MHTHTCRLRFGRLNVAMGTTNEDGRNRSTVIDLGDGQFSERCDVDGSFFNSDAIPIIFWKSLTSPSSRLFSLTIGNDYFSIILLILGPIILRLFTD